MDFVVASVPTAGLYLVVEFLQEAVQPGLSHFHGPGLIGYVTHFDQNHHQLHTNHNEKTRRPIYISCLVHDDVQGSCLHSHSTHHISVVLVGEVKGRQEGLELVENLVVSRHVSGQNASAEQKADCASLLMKQHEIKCVL